MKKSKRASHAQQGEDVLVLEADGAHARNAELKSSSGSCRRLIVCQLVYWQA
jgi:hypothetical protein